MARVYNFKDLHTVPAAKDLVDIVLSKTQRKTPTVVHARYQIVRIRQFYMRKVKFSQQTFHERLSTIISEFPVLQDLHPFHSNLINVLFDKDHFKLALGQLNRVRTIVDNIAKDYVRLLKYGNSLYRCKLLKRAALGRMCTLIHKLGDTLTYLEDVRQHLARLPNINPHMPSLIVCGFPNVGKSSFVNVLTRMDSEVAPYPFTTQSVFVGHMDYKYQRWQVLDTPGVLDRPLSERSTIEMQAITALGYLDASILYFVDVSSSCGHSITAQAALFDGLAQLFEGKPIAIIANKTDLTPIDKLTPEDKATLQRLSTSKSDSPRALFPSSNVTEEGIMNIRNWACEALKEQRLSVKLGMHHATSTTENILARVTVTQPRQRDAKPRPVCIPPSVQAAKHKKKEEEERKKKEMDVDEVETETDPLALARAAKAENAEKRLKPHGGPSDPSKRTLKNEELEHGGPGVYNFDMRTEWKLEEESWKHDPIPTFYDGKNVADFVDPAVLARLESLEKEEEEQLVQEGLNPEVDEGEIDAEQKELVDKIRAKKKLQAEAALINKTGKPRMPRTVTGVDGKDMESKLEDMGLDTSRVRARSARPAKRRRGLAAEAEEGEEGVQEGEEEGGARVRGHTPARLPQDEGLPNEARKKDAAAISRKKQRVRNKDAKKGEGDRVIPTLMPKHLFSGKRGIGKTDRR